MAPEKPQCEVAAWAGAAVLWLAVCAAALSLALLGLLSVPHERSPVEIENSCTALVAGQVFFILFLWPLFERRAQGGPVTVQLAWAVVRLVALLTLSAPFILIALQTSAAGAGAVIRSQCLFVVLGVAVAAAVRLPRAGSWYYPAMFVLSGVVPFAAYLLRETARVSTGWAGAVSPFWASGVVSAGGQWGGPLIIFAALAAVSVGALLVLGSRCRRPVVPEER